MIFFLVMVSRRVDIVWFERRTNMPWGWQVIEVQRREKSFRFYSYVGRTRCVYNISRTRRVNLINTMGGGVLLDFRSNKALKRVENCATRGAGWENVCEWSFQSDKFLVIPCASSGRTLQWWYPRTTTKAMTRTAVVVAELTAHFIGRLMTLIPGTEWQLPESWFSELRPSP